MIINIPEVSIIMATYNRAHFILETLKSIQNQNFQNWDCLIIDDGGSDNTFEVIEPILNTDSRFKYLQRPEKYTKGLPGCRNYGLDKAAGDFILFFDDDDIAHPDLLAISHSELSNGKFDFCRFQRETFQGEFFYNFDNDTNITREYLGVEKIEKVVLNEIPFNSCQILWNRRCFENKRFKEDLMYAEEWELYSRILSDNFKGVSINKTLMYGRKHANSNTGEYMGGNQIRIQSHIEAYILVFKNLVTKDLITQNLLKHFLQMSFYFRSPRLIKLILKKSNYSLTRKQLYRAGFYFYPLIRPLFVIKGKIIDA
ncbi:glycosyltransferase family 2 protein [Christiangramia sp.]|uniref:glycosyltransferase family 2 protein n=1 Tax=Christiangramia sp. TaxID=1931228 RepID=UPI002618010B|nr:glycosyltransferase family 2 protein [Christiangramia sp.]